MHQERSSTSSSDATKAGRRAGWRAIIRPAIWTIAWLIVIDVALNLIGSTDAAPLGLRRFLDYGNSTEAKLRESVGPTDAESAPLTRTGWLEPEQQPNPCPGCSPSRDGRIVISFYGASFAMSLARCIEENTDNVGCRFLGGPASSPNHSFTVFRSDRSCGESDAVVYAILASNVAGIASTSAATKNAEIPAPFMYPRYRVEADGLRMSSPPCNSLAEFRMLLEDAEQWNAWVEYLDANDEFYSPLIFRQSALDASVLVRFVRGGYALSRERRLAERVYGPSGFLDGSPDIVVLRELIRTFAREAGDRGQLPIVCLFNNRGYSTHLYDVLHEQLEAEGIPYVSSHEAAPASHPDSFGEDGFHFTTAAEKRIVAVMVALLREKGLDVRLRPDFPASTSD